MLGVTGGLLAVTADARLWPGIPHTFGTPAHSYGAKKPYDRSWEWGLFHTTIKDSEYCTYMLEKLESQMDVSGFATVADMEVLMRTAPFWDSAFKS